MKNGKFKDIQESMGWCMIAVQRTEERSPYTEQKLHVNDRKR
jgi:hypothetical protein